jgi:hypothetical protein
MQKVSNEYKASMKSSLRERSYMMISFGLVNQEAQANATVMGNNFAYYSKQTGLFGQRKEDTVYATLEHDFTKVDGSMYFLPRENTSGNYYDTGLISKPLIPKSGYELLIELNVVATDIKGLTINFGEVYPTRFDILTSSGQRIEITDNDMSEFSTEQVLENTTYIKFIFYEMKNPYSRLRIYSIQLGYGLVYYNEDIMDSKLDSYISPICEDVPQIDFMVKLQNYDQYFNVDNPNSAINFLETGQEMYVWYGYQLPNSDAIEWIRGAKLQCSAWESDDYSATIRCQDLFRNMDEEYYKGCYAPAGITYYHAAELVFQDAGIEEYYIDPYLKKSTTKNPIPRVKHKEALQIIANACRCVLSQNRYGRPQIKSSFAPEYDITCNGETEYSHVRNIKSETAKQEYASFAHNYTIVNAEMYYLPENQSKADKYTGYISLQQSNKDCLFEENPIIYITQETACMYYGLQLMFGSTLPDGIIFRTFNDGKKVDEYEVNSDITKRLIVQHDFDDFDLMEIEFTKTKEPFNRIAVDYFSFGDITDFTMERQDMTSSPKSIKQELVKAVRVPCYSYQKGTAEETLISEETEAVKGDIQTYYLGDPTYGCRATFNSSASNVSIIESGDYYVTVKFLITGKYQFEIIGHRYNIVEQYAVKTLNSRGKTITWKNPLVSDMETANHLADWLGDYYNAGIEYEYNTRGNPEIDANDIVYQENAYRPGLKVNIYRHIVNFSQSLSGKVIARRVSEK